MNTNQSDKPMTSVHFINGDELRCEFTQTNRDDDPQQSNDQVDQVDSPINQQQQSNSQFNQQSNEKSNEKSNTQSDRSSENLSSLNNRKSNENSPRSVGAAQFDELESSSFCTINPSNGRIETGSQVASNLPNRNAENYLNYDFAIPLPTNEYKAPPKRSEISSFIHSPFSKTLDTFSKISLILLKDDSSERSDDLFFKPQIQTQHTESTAPQQFPPPSLPEIEAKNPRSRQKPVTEHEYDTELKFKSKLFLFERIFLGGLESDSLRRRLWPILLGIMETEDEDNWVPLRELYNLYMQQWKSITPDQESRFSAFKEKKSMAERDVVRCDRRHPFYQKEENIETLRDILMCYIMHDMDTGYVQGISDLASPILYIYKDDPMKAFWCLTGVLNLTKKNFEMEQTTVKNLLIKLFKLVNLTDPCFAEFLADNESDNCYFSFRWLICLFKREFVKADSSYDQLLILWDTLWSVHAYEKARQDEAQEEFERQLNIIKENKSNNVNNETTSDLTNSFSNKFELDTTLGTSPPFIIQSFENKGGDFDDSTNTANNNNHAANRASDSENDEVNQLTNFELFFLSISLAIIRQERDLIFTQKLDASGILKHFNSLNLNDYLDETLKHATLVWYWLKSEGAEQLYNENTSSKEWKCSGGYDLLL